MSEKPKNLTDAASWNKHPHGVELGATYDTFTETIQSIVEAEQKSAETQDQSLGAVAQLKNRITTWYNTATKSKIVQTERGNHTGADTSVGGCPGINSLWAFGKDDDIVHPLHSTDGVRGDSGLGRVYHEMYYTHQRTLYMTFGVPVFHDLESFYKKAVNGDQADLMNTGYTSNLSKMLGPLYDTAAFAFKMPMKVITSGVNIANKVIQSLGDDRSVTKYYSLKPTMPLYYRMVNGILANLSVGMGLYPDFPSGEKNEDGDDGIPKEYKVVTGDLPEIFQNGPDIVSIMDKRRSRLIPGAKPRSCDDLTNELRNTDLSPKGFLDAFGRITDIVDEYSRDMLQYVGFRVEKGTDANETISNTSGPSSISSMLNSKASSAKDMKSTYAGGKLSKGWIGDFTEGLTSAMKGISKAVIGKDFTSLISGNGYLDMPEIWKGSSFTKNHTFTLQLRSKYADPVSIFQSIYIPLSLILTAALPRGIGQNSYTSPFILEAYCAGLYAIPLGIIENVSIRRGLSEYGWAVGSNLPTAVDVNITIKDLSTVLFLSLLDGSVDSIVNDTFRSNTSLTEYLHTLSGIGLDERTHRLKILRQKMKVALLINKTTTFNPLWQSLNIANNPLVKAYANVTPSKWWTPND